MSENTQGTLRMPGEVAEVKAQLLAMGTMVESLMATTVVALLDGDAAAVPELREEDCRTHEQWLEVDKLCTELLTGGNLDADQVRFLSAAVKIAGAFKRIGDEAFHIAEGMRACEPDCLTAAKAAASVPRLAELAQEMLNGCIDSLIEGDPDRSAGLHEASRTLTASQNSAVRALMQGVGEGEIGIAVGAALTGVAQRLERIGNEALDAATHVRHFYLRNHKADAG
jgi:phosphate transport system protein